MKLIKILTLTLLLSALPACAALTKSDKLVVPPEPPKLTKPDSVLLEKCIGPVELGNKALVQAQVERLWMKDRQNLLSCARKHLSLRDFYADRDGRLVGKK
ncbi:anaerobic dehydrogenase protein [Rhizobium rhizogenes K84]|uniref:Anaerobic dehydrogenase protein n=1 Tax=Rhizobium rhizogenes (strain K84 / ATCC BAA-868) TaxID=311403 RepID=B9JF50_RHIR8|nr:anaerobic dehydrogenase protein [Rhizobium rhizogenes K84]